MPKVKDRKRHTDIYYFRVDSIVNMILENDRYLKAKRNKEIVQKICDNFGLDEKMAYIYLSEAKKEVREIASKGKKKAFVKAIRDREFLLHKAKSGKIKKDKKGNEQILIEPDYKLALEIMKDRDKLFGLYTEEIRTTGELTVKNVDLSRFTEKGLERIQKGDRIEEILLDTESVVRD